MSQSTQRRLSRWGSAFLTVSLISTGCATKSPQAESTVQTASIAPTAERLQKPQAKHSQRRAPAKSPAPKPLRPWSRTRPRPWQPPRVRPSAP